MISRFTIGARDHLRFRHKDPKRRGRLSKTISVLGSMVDMRKVLSSAAVVAFIIFSTSGCADLDSARTTTIGDACQKAIQEQNEAWSDHDASEEKIREAETNGLNDCKDLDEWSTAVSYNPGSVGYEELSLEEAANSIYLACSSVDAERKTPVCADAGKRGYLDES